MSRRLKNIESLLYFLGRARRVRGNPQQLFKITLICTDFSGIGFQYHGTQVVFPGLLMIAQPVIADAELDIRDIIVAVLPDKAPGSFIWFRGDGLLIPVGGQAV